ncbi:hypothetical protein LXL04_028091 [Taraxacum kok-saghyz]
MAEELHFGMYLKVDLNYNGLFVTNPRSYEGGEHYLFIDMDFVGLDYHGCMRFLERFTREPFEKLFYYLRNRPLATDYAHFLDRTYEEPGTPISVYMDHSGDGLEAWFDSSSDEHGSETPYVGQLSETPHMWMNQLKLPKCVDHLKHIMYTDDDTFLNKLCANDITDEEEDNAKLLEQPSFNPNLHWRQ